MPLQISDAPAFIRESDPLVTVATLPPNPRTAPL